MKRNFNWINFIGRFFCFFLLAFFSFHSNAYPAASSYYDTVQKIYIGYYQRPADPGGLIYWADRLDKSGGILGEIIEAFANAPESRALYGTINSSNISTVVNGIYITLFGRPAETGGLNYYANGFNTGQFTAATIMLNVLSGAQGGDLLSVNNKVTAANLFTRAIDPDFDGSYLQATYAGDSDNIAARNFLTLYATSVKVPTQAEATAYVRTNIADTNDPINTTANITQQSIVASWSVTGTSIQQGYNLTMSGTMTFSPGTFTYNTTQVLPGSAPSTVAGTGTWTLNGSSLTMTYDAGAVYSGTAQGNSTSFSMVCSNGWTLNFSRNTTSTSATLSWTINNNAPYLIYIKFFDDTRNLVWPDSTSSYTADHSSQTYTLTCTTGDQICYGGSYQNDFSDRDYWGVGLTNSKSCTDCCTTCQNGSVSSTLTESQSTSTSLSWTINNSTDYIIYVKFFDDTRNLVWPSSGSSYTANQSSQTYGLTCTPGDQICYGGSYNNDMNDSTYWGVGLTNSKSCTDCCTTCQNGSVSSTLTEGSSSGSSGKAPGVDAANCISIDSSPGGLYKPWLVNNCSYSIAAFWCDDANCNAGGTKSGDTIRPGIAFASPVNPLRTVTNVMFKACKGTWSNGNITTSPSNWSASSFNDIITYCWQ